jgi:acetyl-CoA decarbonylase/synthase complex subunit beta
MIIRGDLEPLKYAIALGLMKLGCPAVVPSSFPFPYGNRIAADTDAGILEASGGFPNLRKKYFDGEIITLPQYANQAYANQEFTPQKTLGGTVSSFFCVRPAGGESLSHVAEAEPKSVEPAAGLGILIEIDEPSFTDDIAWVVEKSAYKSLGFLEGHRASLENHVFSLALSQDAAYDESRTREVLYWGIRLQYPRIKHIETRLIRDEGELARLSPRIREYKEARKAAVDAMTEENTEVLCACTECRPFSLVHTCILTPDRMPMCNSRTYFTVKAASFFGSDLQPHKRGRERDLPLRSTFHKGKVLDSLRGEYEGANRAYEQMTHGALRRVFLHSLRDCPQTSCGCFQNLAFYLKGSDGIGIMKRGSEAVTPDGRNWETLANEAGGKQTPGILGVSLDYIRSERFLKGDGGIGKVVWMDSDLARRVGDRLLPGQRVATEKDVKTIRELEEFFSR